MSKPLLVQVSGIRSASTQLSQSLSKQDCLRSVIDIWPWLPAFIAAASSPNLNAAARKIFVSRSAVSRTLGKLESRLGCLLFERRKEGLRMNDNGRALLEVTQPAVSAVGSLTAGLRLVRGGA